MKWQFFLSFRFPDFNFTDLQVKHSGDKHDSKIKTNSGKQKYIENTTKHLR